MTRKLAKDLSLAIGIILMFIGLAAFLPNPIIGPEGVIARYDYACYIDIAFGLMLIAASVSGEGTAAFGLYVVGMLSGVLAAICFLMRDGSGAARLLDVVRISGADMLFFAVLTPLLALCGAMNTAKKQLFYE